MLAKWWRKLVKRVSFSDNVKSTVSNKVENVVTQVKGDNGNNVKGKNTTKNK